MYLAFAFPICVSLDLIKTFLFKCVLFFKVALYQSQVSQFPSLNDTHSKRDSGVKNALCLTLYLKADKDTPLPWNTKNS